MEQFLRSWHNKGEDSDRQFLSMDRHLHSNHTGLSWYVISFGWLSCVILFHTQMDN